MKSLAVCLILACIAAPGRAQAPTKPPAAAEDADAQTRYVLDVFRVNLLFTVTDRRGRFVTGLTENDFQVFEGKTPQKIVSFAAEGNLPLRLAILVDSSNSIRDRLRFIQESAIEFINSVLRPGQDRAAVISFDTAPELQVDLTDNIERLTRVIRNLRAGGGTSMYDAIYFASRDRLGQEEGRDKYRRALVVLSDGEDNQSRYTRDQALEMAQRNDVVIYTISTNITRNETAGDKVLKYYAAETGGVAFFPLKSTDLSQSFENIANELRHQYNIFYRPEPLKLDGSFRPVTVSVKDRRNLVVRARRGYYATAR
jgi:VWFA-related protein